MHNQHDNPVDAVSFRIHNQAFERSRRRMVEEQLIPRGISDPRVLEAMLTIPRHLFVSEALQPLAHSDSALPIGSGQTISQPYMVARMSQLLELKGSERILEIGTGCGYQTAVLSRLGRLVFSIERIHSLYQMAQRNLRVARVSNVVLAYRDGTLGWDGESQFDAILAAAAGDHVPDVWMQQLRDGGLLVMPLVVGDQHLLIRRRKRGNSFIEEQLESCLFVPLLTSVENY